MRFKRFKITPKTGATARSGTSTSRPPPTWSSAPRTAGAPWTLVEANDKKFARVKVLETVCGRVERALDAL